MLRAAPYYAVGRYIAGNVSSSADNSRGLAVMCLLEATGENPQSSCRRRSCPGHLLVWGARLSTKDRPRATHRSSPGVRDKKLSLQTPKSFAHHFARMASYYIGWRYSVTL